MKFCRNSVSFLAKRKRPAIGLSLSPDEKRRIVMRIKATALLLTIACMHVFGEGNAQKVSITGKRMPIKTVLEEIKKQTGYIFWYDNSILDVNKKVTVTAKEETVPKILNHILQDQSLTYTIIEKTIVIQKKPESSFKDRTSLVLPVGNLPPPTSHQPGAAEKALGRKILDYHPRFVDIHGKVTDEKGEGLPGVSIILKGTQKGTLTDAAGSYTLSLQHDSPESVNPVLSFSFVGYVPQDVPVDNRTIINVTMKTDTKMLGEHVVVGYGVQSKVNVTGSVAQVGPRVLENRALTNVSQALQGTMAGVTVQATDGRPGAGANIQIRGFSSLNSGGALIIVDGTPGSLNDLNPNDIASISVLKDAASAAIYGARGAEGVILVTTKTGEAGKVKIQYQGGVTSLSPTVYPKLSRSYDGAMLANLSAKNAGANPFYSDALIAAMRDPQVEAIPQAGGQEWDYVADFDWAGYFLKRASNQNHNISISGGNATSKYLISAGWLDQNGYFAKFGPDNFDRYNVRVNLVNDLIPEKLTLDTRISLSSSKMKESSVGQSFMMQSINQAGTSMPLYNPDGTYARFRMQQNTLQLLKEAGFNEVLSNDVETRAALTWNISNEWNVKAVAGYSVSFDKGTLFGSGYYKYRPATGAGNFGWQNKPTQITLTDSYTRYYTGQLLVNYNKQINRHHFAFLGGGSVESNHFDTNGATRFNILSNSLPALNLGSTVDAQNSFSGYEWGIVSGFGRINYDFNDRYLLEMNIRADASSRFSKTNRLGVFPSFSAGWRVTEEDFMKSQSIFSNLKLRASYGRVGNQNGLGYYDHIPVYQFVTQLIPFPGGDAQNVFNPRLPSQNRTWETVITSNIGVEMSFFKNRLSAEADLFVKKNKDMLIAMDLPSVIGVTVPTGNNGALQTKGWELTLNWQDKIDKLGLKYNVGFNVYDQTNKILDLKTTFTSLTAGTQNLQGYPVNSIFGYRAEGYFQSEEEVKAAPFQHARTAAGDLRYADIDGDGKISQPNDLQYLGNTTPRFVFGMNMRVEYKGFDLSAIVQGVGKRNYYLTGRAVQPYFNTFDNNSFEIQQDYWTPENQDALFPRPVLGGSWNYQTSSKWMQNASYIRLKNFQLGYTLPRKWLSGHTIRAYFSGENLWTKTKLIMFDPEVNNGDGSIVYPLNKAFTVGINMSL